MAYRTGILQQLPWIGGLNTNVDPGLVPPNQLTVADNVLFGTQGSRRKRPGIKHNWDNGSSSTDKIIGLHDFWCGNSTSRTHWIVGVSSARNVYAYNVSTGARTTLTVGGTAWAGTLTTCSMITFNNVLIIAVDGSGNVMKYWDGNTANNVLNVAGTPPQASILREHQGRILCNDKTNPDRLHYSPVHDHTTWNGAGDSGGFDIGKGDGDPIGITSIFPTFQGDSFIAKKNKLYRMSGFSPETYVIKCISHGVGCSSHNSVVAIEQGDVVWVSEKGVHSLGTTESYGDFVNTYLSADIQATFNDDFDRSRLKFSCGAYLPEINSVAFAFTEESSVNRSLTTNAVNNCLYLYNVALKSWYRWPDIPASSICTVSDTDQKRFFIGTHTTRVSKSFNGLNYDVSAAGVNTAIRFKISTGLVYPAQDPFAVSAFKRFVLYYRPRATHTISVSVRIDNVTLSPENQLSFSEVGASDLLGTTFILGTSSLGYERVMAPYTRNIDGVGRGAKITIEQAGIDEQADILGFALEWESAGKHSEVFL